jgi:predicted nucleotidyltransferase
METYAVCQSAERKDMLSIEEIKKRAIPVAGKYNVSHLEVFGSYANGTASSDSDVDFLVEFSEKVPSIFSVMGFREELNKALGVSVDVVTLPLQRPDMLFIEKRLQII